MTQTDAPRTPGGYRANLDALQRAQKPARGTAAYSRLVNRPLGRRVAAAAATTGMTPNVATVISASIALSDVPRMPTGQAASCLSGAAGQGHTKYPGLVSVTSGQLWPVAITT